MAKVKIESTNETFMFDIARQHFRDVLGDCLNDAAQLASHFKSYMGSDLEKRTVVDQTLRDLVRDKIHLKQVDELLAIVSASVQSAKNSTCSMNLPFILLGDILDCLTLELCDHVFKYIEEGVVVWRSPSFYNAGKNYLLRMCNDLLRRLSQSRNTVFCGRIQLFLARLFPLDEKSALNLVSQFNLDNVTVFNKLKSTAESENTNGESKQQEAGDDEDGMEVDQPASPQQENNLVDHKLYLNIWNLQDMFRYPVQCYTGDLWESFTKNAESVLRVFSNYKIEAVHTASSSASADDVINTSPLSTSKQSTYKRAYFPKFLTSEKLSDLQLSDTNFRRQIYVQFLILFQYLTGAVKFKGTSLVLNEGQKKWIADTSTTIYALLDETPPNGKAFASYVKHVIEREEFWVTWKNKGCPSFMKQQQPAAAPVADDNQQQQAAAPPPVKRAKLSSIAQDFIDDKPLGLGSCELTRLWSICPDNLASCKSADRKYLPTAYDFFSEAAEQEDPINQIEDQYKDVRKSDFQWKGLRLLSKRSELFFTSQTVDMQFKPIHQYLTNTIVKLAKTFPKATGTTTADDSKLKNGGEGKSDETATADVLDEEENKDFADEEDQQDTSQQQEDETTSSGDVSMKEADDAITSDDVDVAAEVAAGKWQKLAHAFKLKPQDIKEIEQDSEDDSMRARQALVTWQDYNEKSATRSALIKLMTSCGIDTSGLSK